MIARAADVVRELMLATPPAFGGGLTATLEAWRVARRFRELDVAGRRDLVDLFTKSAGDLLDRWFEAAPVKAALGFDATVGQFASPYSAGSAYLLLHYALGGVNGKRGQWGHALGGMGAITQAMARECAARGVTIRTAAPVARVIVKRARAAGVELESGEVVEAKRVVANVNPKLLFAAHPARSA
jgi:phytoene dehydrogenase-like protein